MPRGSSGSSPGPIRSLKRATRPGARVPLDEALSLWNGPAYDEFVSEPWAWAEASRLEELRLSAREDSPWKRSESSARPQRPSASSNG